VYPFHGFFVFKFTVSKTLGLPIRLWLLWSMIKCAWFLSHVEPLLLRVNDVIHFLKHEHGRSKQMDAGEAKVNLCEYVLGSWSQLDWTGVSPDFTMLWMHEIQPILTHPMQKLMTRLSCGDKVGLQWSNWWYWHPSTSIQHNPFFNWKHQLVS